MKLTFPFLLFAFSCAAQTDSENRTFSGNHYTIQYPSTWSLDTSKRMGTELFLFTPLENDSDRFSENINILVQDLHGHNMDLKKYRELTENPPGGLSPGTTILESGILKKGHTEYYKLLYLMTQGNFKLKINTICFIRDEMAYLVTFTAEEKKYDRYKKAGEKILDSFSLKKQ